MKARFTVADIQKHALAIVERDGLSALTMRSLATSLQTGPMTLYNYVDSREALEELVVDAVVGRIDLPEPTDDWLADTRAVATAAWRTFRAHPAIIPLVVTRRTTSRAQLRLVEAQMAALARGGLDPAAQLVAFRTIIGFVMGIAQNELAGPLTRERDPAAAAERIAALNRGEFPAIAVVTPFLAAHAGEEEFEAGLTAVLAGIEKTLCG
ncbi:TetR/AcrR family transcriptional regulator [Actinoplanes sp. TBRC 11911]|uniref:TetR/AcrR family transcriptional regulator C-terminal domain-containing protein n=1 Tax=Actinoplanes sp. TBRC 11911 TaxID=2729386 RepID=UPI00145CDB1A|nr:TetR/AcrR family transcriptional regulator C-terminal domain-containing protein [Actinoplanes sp. TBRC 11911]NMO56153.1 TetR/AcrR family transcriptional regulator [Actinoplanes sp. TBRC 11911]